MWLTRWLLKRFSGLAGLFGLASVERRFALRESMAARSRDRLKPSARLELQLLETRETPDDLFSLLGNGILFGGLPLMGQLAGPCPSRSWRRVEDWVNPSDE